MRLVISYASHTKIRTASSIEMRSDQLPQRSRSVMFGTEHDRLARQRATHAFMHHLIQRRILPFAVTEQ
jgi:hypothetical protein